MSRPPLHHCKHSIHTTRFTGDIIIGSARIFERKPYELTAALDFRPIEQLITHACTICRVMPPPAEGSAFAAIQAR